MTKAQRAQAICDAIINGTATTAQMTRLADAFIANDLHDPTTYTQSQKADYLVDSVRQLCLRAIKRHEGDIAEAQALATATSGVDSSFPEA